jgi:Glycosyl hydrolase family 76
MTDRTLVDQGYTTLRRLWDKTKEKNGTDSLPDVAYGFWHAGNTLDTFMDYLGRARPEGYQKTAAALADQGVEIFKQVIEVDPTQYPFDQPIPTKAWWDDYGWWGIAFLKVHFLIAEPRYLHGAQVCWHFMEKGGRHYAGDNPPPSEKGGTWNHDPAQNGMQNVITNALFLTLSAQLYNRTRDEQYLTGALAQYYWFDYQLNNGAQYTVSLGPPAWLIHQLPLGQEEHFWTGDQGVLLGGLMSLRESLLSSDPERAKHLQDMCYAIVSGVKLSDQMVQSPPWAPGSEVLHEVEPSFGDWRFDLNGSVGKGVLMRYLAAFLGKRDGLIADNAASVSYTLQQDGYFAVSWVDDPEEKMQDGGNRELGYLTRQCSGQDAMNAWLLPPT